MDLITRLKILVPKAAGDQRTYIWNDQASMRLQPHQLKRSIQSKWGNGVDHDRLQYETSDKYPRYREIAGETQSLETRLQEGLWVCKNTRHFKAI